MDRCPVMSTLQGKFPASEQTVNVATGTVAITGTVNGASRLRRMLLMLAGLFFVFLAAIGVILPGIPATGPLILASICLTKSCPWLEDRLVRSRFFAPFHRYLDGNAHMPLKARMIAMAMMWTAITISSVVLVRSGQVGDWVVALVLLSGLIGTVVIARFGTTENRNSTARSS